MKHKEDTNLCMECEPNHEYLSQPVMALGAHAVALVFSLRPPANVAQLLQHQ